MDRLIFVVMGSRGEYSDRVEWPVFAFENEESATEHVTALDVWLREHNCHMDDDKHVDTRVDYPACPLDPAFSTDYTGTRYCVMPVKLKP